MDSQESLFTFELRPVLNLLIQGATEADARESLTEILDDIKDMSTSQRRDFFTSQILDDLRIDEQAVQSAKLTQVEPAVPVYAVKKYNVTDRSAVEFVPREQDAAAVFSTLEDAQKWASMLNENHHEGGAPYGVIEATFHCVGVKEVS